MSETFAPDDYVYLDHNGSAPLAPEVIEAMRPWFEQCTGNPASGHFFGRRGKEAIERSRESVAKLLGCTPGEIVFTSGGTESDNLAIKGIAERRGSGHLVTAAIEHPAVLNPCRYLERRGYGLTVVGVDEHGAVDPEELCAAYRDDTILVSLMLANNEVGTFQPVREVAERARARGIVVHSDAAQVIGKEPVKVDELGVDLLTIAGHKLNAPKGVGALYIRNGIELEPQQLGAGHEGGLRSGTQDVLEIVGLGAAAERFERQSAAIRAHYLSLREYFEAALTRAIPGLQLNGHPEQRLVNTANFSFDGTVSGDLLAACPLLAAAAGAACHKDHTHASHVLTAMRLPLSRIQSSIRFSLGYGTTTADLDRAVRFLSEAVRELRRS